LYLEIVDRNQNILFSATEVKIEQAVQLFQKYAIQEDCTFLLKYNNDQILYISIDKNFYPLLLQLSEDEFYDYISTLQDLGQTEFIQGGQLVSIDKKFLANKDVAKQSIKRFAQKPESFREDRYWQLQF